MPRRTLITRRPQHSLVTGLPEVDPANGALKLSSLSFDRPNTRRRYMTSPSPQEIKS